MQQYEATKSVSTTLLNYAVGLNDKTRPIGVFLFIGPTGVGKTELAKTLTQEIYGDMLHLIRFDMSHFSMEGSISRLIGTPPGYIQHNEGGQLTNHLLKNSQVIILLDEIEKSHSDIRQCFLPVFDEGYIVDAQNNFISCQNTIFIMTSNLCANKIAELYRKGFSPEDILHKIEPELMESLSPELYNRVEPILFIPFEKEAMSGLVKKFLDNVRDKIYEEKEIDVSFDSSLHNFLENEGFHPLLGARPLKKLIEKRVITALAHYLIKENLEKGDKIIMHYEADTKLINIKLL